MRDFLEDELKPLTEVEKTIRDRTVGVIIASVQNGTFSTELWWQASSQIRNGLIETLVRIAPIESMLILEKMPIGIRLVIIYYLEEIHWRPLNVHKEKGPVNLKFISQIKEALNRGLSTTMATSLLATCLNISVVAAEALFNLGAMAHMKEKSNRN